MPLEPVPFTGARAAAIVWHMVTVIEEDGCFAVLAGDGGELLVSERLHDGRGTVTWRIASRNLMDGRRSIHRQRPSHDLTYHPERKDVRTMADAPAPAIAEEADTPPFTADRSCPASVDLLADAIIRLATLLDEHADGLDIENAACSSPVSRPSRSAPVSFAMHARSCPSDQVAWWRGILT